MAKRPISEVKAMLASEKADASPVDVTSSPTINRYLLSTRPKILRNARPESPAT